MKNNCNDKCDKCSSYRSRGIPCINCDDGTNCQEIHYTSCVIYNRDDLECYGIQSGDTLTSVVTKLLEFVFPNCN